MIWMGCLFVVCITWLGWLGWLGWHRWRYSPPQRYTFVDGQNRIHHFPAIWDQPSVELSLIVPAFNEQDRLTRMLEPALRCFLQATPSLSFEIIVVDDGSTDDTAALGQEFVERHGSDHVRVLSLLRNQGKGAAVQQGMLHARGEYLLMADGDGATQIEDWSSLLRAIKIIETGEMGMAIGSRPAQARSWHRSLLSRCFQCMLVRVGGVEHVRDTQCGFKMFTRETARWLFANQKTRRWCFDVELLYLARQLNVPVREVQVNWEEVPGTKLNLWSAPWLMLLELLVMRLAYACGVWRIQNMDPFRAKSQ